jgi:fluoride exporter
MNTFILSLYIGVGGFLGAVARFVLSRALGSFFGAFPFGTLFVNVSGSFGLGLILYGVMYGKSLSPEWRSLWTIGFIGAYTTMSTFAYESMRLLELGDYRLFALNSTANFFLCLAAVWLGKYAALSLFR